MAIYYLESLPHGVRRNGEKLNTRLHAEYITRQGAYEKIRDREEDFVYRSFGNMPSWAKSDLDFWEAAEENRRKNGRAYREIRLGLQEELSLAENIQTIETFLKDSGIQDNHAYSYAIHDKTAMFSDEHRNIHAHIMFSEKIAEKNRPLSAEEYFKRYTVQSDGSITGGYKTERFWATQNSIVQLREKWADIVNEHFEKKGLDIRVSEKTLVKQKEALLAQGKFEEADLLDREPAPHLGDVVKNPKTRETIREMIRQIDSEEIDDSESDSSSEKENNNLSAKSNDSKQLELLIFAYDAVIRKTAREIQKERKALREKQAKLQQQQIEEEAVANEEIDLSTNPMVITVGDVIKRLDEKMELESVAVKENQEKLHIVESKIQNKKAIHKEVFNLVTDGEYTKLHKAYFESYKQVRLLKHDLKENPASNFEEYKVRNDALQKAERERAELRKSVKLLHHNLNNENRFIKERHLKEMTTANNQYIETSKVLQSNIEKHRRTHQFYYYKIKPLFDERPDRVLFAEKLPTEVSLYNRYEGKIALRDLKKVIQFTKDSNGKTIRQQFAIIPHTKSERNNQLTVQAIKIGEPVFQGKTAIYELEVSPGKSKQGINYIKVDSAIKTSKQARLYEYRDYTDKIKDKYKESNRDMPPLQFRDPTINHNNDFKHVSQSFADKTVKILNKTIDEFTKDEATGKTDNLWYENESYGSEKTEFEQTEERIKRGWSL